jgi:FAD/FMN-containing dehydrogenase
MLSNPIFEALTQRLGGSAVRGPGDIEPRYLGDWMCRDEAAQPAALILPGTTSEVAAALSVCNALGCPVVVQGGRTGLAGGATPADGWAILSMERMRAIGAPELASGTLVVEAGATLQRVQEAADDVGLLFPLDIGGRGSCTIGGNISTNAGGNRVLRYGMMRELVLGMEVVLADGRVLTSLNTMLKNNTGYDLKQLFIGSEGTLGVVTRAVLRLFPKPGSRQTALCAVTDFDRLIALLTVAKSRLGSTLAAFEVMWSEFYRLATQVACRRAPLPGGSPAYVLIETLGTDAPSDAAQFQQFLEAATEANTISDAVIAKSSTEAQEIWSIRDASGEFQKTFWPYVGFDVSLPIGRIGRFIDECTQRLCAEWPGIRLVFFGHLADSNIHICVRRETVAEQPHERIDAIVYRCVGEFEGAVSAEHGIGLLKKKYLGLSRSAGEIAVMRGLKQALDPRNILNRGKIFE